MYKRARVAHFESIQKGNLINVKVSRPPNSLGADQ